MFTVAGAPITVLLVWKCPGSGCKRKIVRETETEIIQAGVLHWQAQHGPLPGQGDLLDELAEIED